MDEPEHIDLRTGTHKIDPATDLQVNAASMDGGTIQLDAFRAIEGDDVHVVGHVLSADADGQVIEGQAIMPKKLEAAKAHTVEFFHTKKGKVFIVGSAVLTIAAGTGMIIRQFNKRG